jgi:microcystin-dependent protein
MDGLIGEIRAFPYDFNPHCWLPCNGSSLQINQHEALFSVIGYAFGGDVNKGLFNLPNLQGRVVAGVDTGDVDFHKVGVSAGSDSISLKNSNQIPRHKHTLNGAVHTNIINDNVTNQPSKLALLTNATSKPKDSLEKPASIMMYSNGPITKDAPSLHPDTICMEGKSIGHYNMQPFMVLKYCICYNGAYPVRPRF